MLINGSSALLCMDEANALYLFKDDAIHALSSNEDNSISLSEKESEVIETLKSFVTNYESQFLDTTHLYSHQAYSLCATNKLQKTIIQNLKK